MKSATLIAVMLAATPRAAEAAPPSGGCGANLPMSRACIEVLFDGDSVSAGVAASPGHKLDEQFERAFQRPAHIDNVSVSGRPVAECLRRFDELVPSHHSSDASANLIIFHAGDNDVAQNRSAADIYADFTQYVAKAHAGGWKVVVSTELPRMEFSPVREADLTAYNRLLAENKASADAVVDLAQDPRFVDLTQRETSPLFSQDHVHPSDEGYAVLAGLLANAARSLLP